MEPLFDDRAAGGRALAPLLGSYAGRGDVVVLALTRGGVPVAVEVAKALKAPLDVLLVREPGHHRALYLGDRPPLELAGCTAIVVDDGIVTGASMQIALRTLRAANPDWIVVAAPIAPADAATRIGTATDELVCVHAPADFCDLPAAYRDFSPVRDDDVRRLLAPWRT